MLRTAITIKGKGFEKFEKNCKTCTRIRKQKQIEMT